MLVFCRRCSTPLGAAHKLIGNALPISAIVGKVKLAMNLGHIVDLMPLHHTHSANTHTQKT